MILCTNEKYKIDDESSNTFDTIPALIKTYQSNKHILSKLSSAILLRPIENYKKSTPKKPLRVPSIKNGTALGNGYLIIN